MILRNRSIEETYDLLEVAARRVAAHALDASVAINAIIAITCRRTYLLAMASITIRKLDDEVKKRLRIRAAQAGHSMEEEVRLILTREAGKDAPRGLNGPEFLALMQSLFGPEHGVDLEIPPRNWGRPPVDFSEE